MINERSPLAIAVFLLFIGATLGLSFWLGRRTKSSQGYFAAHGQIPWFVNGIAFAGDYLSAASFLGICGLIAFYGYDGFLYSIGYLAGWIVALFVVAEPIKRLGRYTFADALDAKFGSRWIQLVAGISTLVVSVFYLIPQMVGAGALIRPLLNYPHYVGVLLVGVTVIVIVVTAGMVSTTYVQFLKGSLLVFFSTILTAMILNQGFRVADGGVDGYQFRTIGPVANSDIGAELTRQTGETILAAEGAWSDLPFVRTRGTSGVTTLWRVESLEGEQVLLREGQMETTTTQGEHFVNGLPKGIGEGHATLRPVGNISRLPDDMTETGAVGPFEYFRVLQQSEVMVWRKQKLALATGDTTTVYYPESVTGSRVLRPGEYFKGIRSNKVSDRLNFVSLMLALFCGTASLPHILIRYYTVKDEQSARRSTIVGIGTIGYFYILTLYMGLGAMTSGALDVTDTNMAAPLLAKSISQLLFAVISGIAFTTVLGTVSGLILASSGAVTRDFL
ncbi:MAG: cation acetate symporter, partial [Planctomycetales bacterium]|nr:cation acetate symporter [Planctomycetales bacterium]